MVLLFSLLAVVGHLDYVVVEQHLQWQLEEGFGDRLPRLSCPI